MSSTEPIQITIYPLLSSTDFRGAVPKDIFTELVNMNSDPNTEIHVKPIAPHMLRPIYKLFHVIEVNISDMFADEPSATAMDMGTAYYTLRDNVDSTTGMEFLSNLLDYQSHPTRKQLKREMEDCVDDSEIYKTYLRQNDEKQYHNKIGLNTQEFFDKVKRSSTTVDESDRLPYVWVNNQPVSVKDTESLRKASMSQFFAEYMSGNDDWTDKEDEDNDSGDENTDVDGDTNETQPE